MNPLKYKRIIYFIGLVILITLCIQVYWNFKNYQTGKAQLVRDVQTALDQAVDQYYVDLAKGSPLTLYADSLQFTTQPKTIKRFVSQDSIHVFDPHRLMDDSSSTNLTILRSETGDSSEISFSFYDESHNLNIEQDLISILDSLENPVKELSSRIIVSISEDTLSLGRIDSLFSEELKRKNIDIAYGLVQEGLNDHQHSIRPEVVEKAQLDVTTQSPYFFFNKSLTAYFSNVTLAVLKQNLGGILLSFILVIGVILCLLYLLRIINEQKQLAAVKNDLISNITHEFKTPIATIGIALEAMQNYTEEGDTDKYKRYAQISTQQVNKLNLMVEKLLETATLDSNQLELNKETVDLAELLQKITLKELFATSEKKIIFNAEPEHIPYKVDAFHFENAVNNIVDNAIKYGGDHIAVSIEQLKDRVRIQIEDSGTGLEESHKKQLFEKFYRVPKGNTHDVKGFGIGLYYTQTIIEKHGGTIDLQVRPNTNFTIDLPL